MAITLAVLIVRSRTSGCTYTRHFRFRASMPRIDWLPALQTNCMEMLLTEKDSPIACIAEESGFGVESGLR